MLLVIKVNTAGSEDAGIFKLIVAVQTHVHRLSRTSISLFRTTKEANTHAEY